MLINQVMTIILFCLYLFCFAAVLLSCCFRTWKMSNHHLRHQWQYHLQTNIQMMIIWSSNQFCCSCITCPRPTAFSWMRKGYGNTDGVSFWLVLHLLHPAHSSLQNWCTLKRETSLRPSTLCTTVWIILQTFPSSTALLVIFFAWPFH